MNRGARLLIAGRLLTATAILLCVQDSFGQTPPNAAVPGAVASPPGAPPNPNAKPGDPNAKPGDPAKPGEPAKPSEAALKVIRRAEYLKPPESAPKAEALLGPDGKVGFSFEGTLWPPVLEWLAEISDKSLDWQELPGDVLNLRTQRRYTPEEARDLLNRHLLARGYTLLLEGEVFTVANIKTINPGIVPRVTVEELETRMPYEFVKISLPLDWIMAEDAATQLAPMISPNGKLSAIKSVNRLEAMDAVTNLRDVVGLLQDEQTSRVQDKALVREFRLKHVRADEAVNTLMGILGIEKREKLTGSGGNMNGMMQMMQMMQQQMQQMGNRGGSPAGGDQKAAEPRLVVNSRENSILAVAPPDKMEIIEQTVKALDVPTTSEGTLLQNLDRMRVYRLTTLNPGPLAEILSEIGDLSPGSRLRVDKENNSLVVFGSLADHVTVQSLVERLDGSGRQFEVVQLKRLQAEEVAGSIQFMLGKEEKEEPRRNRYYYSYYDDYGSSDSTTRKDDRPFRVDADVANNRLLIWANELEMKEIDHLLMKMGETPSDGMNPQTMRTLEFSSPQEAEKLLRQLQKLWPNVAPNELLLPQPVEEPEDKRPSKPIEPTTDIPSREPKSHDHLALVAMQKRNAASDADSVPEEAPPQSHDLQRHDLPSKKQQPRRHPLADDYQTTPPVVVRTLPDGRVLISSPDTRALDQFEDLVRDLAPKTPDFQVFHLQHENTWAYGLEMILKEYFETESDDKPILDWYGDIVNEKKSQPARLSRQRKLKIISDADSRTILVQNATAGQLEIIGNLIKIYDQPSSNDPRAVRVTRIFPLKYSKAATIAETLKSVYRDLLSSNDPALQSKDKQQQQQPQGPAYTYVYGRSNNTGDKKEDTPEQPIKFRGLLSVGVDEISNAVVVSSASGLMEDIAELIESLDKMARPNHRVEVVQLQAGLNAEATQQKLQSIFGGGSKAPKINVSTSGGANPTPPQAPPVPMGMP